MIFKYINDITMHFYKLNRTMKGMKAMKETVNEVRMKLHRLNEVNNMIVSDCERLNALSNIASPSIDRIGSNPNRSTGSATSRIATKRMELENEIDALCNERDNLEQYAKPLFKRLSPKLRLVMELRYLDSLQWLDVASALFSNKKDFNDNADRYRHVVTTRHGNAITKMAEILEHDRNDQTSKNT